MFYPILKSEDPTLLKKTKVDEIKELKYETEKHDQQNFMKSLKNDIDFYIKKYECLKKMEVLIFITELLVGFASTISSSTLSIINPSAGIIISSSTALLTSVAI